MRAGRVVSMAVACCALLLLSACGTAVPDPVPFAAGQDQVTAVQADHESTGSDGIVMGRVTTAGGEPVVGVTVTARAQSATPGCLRCGETVTRTAQDGSFTFDLPEGGYFFTCTTSSGGLCRPALGSPVEVVAVRSSETDVALRLVPRPRAHPR